MFSVMAGPLPRQRAAIVALLAFLTAACWAWLVWRAAGMDLRGMRMMTPTMGMGVLPFLVMWTIMMAGMMFPSALPMVLMFHRIETGKRQRGEAFVSTWVFLGAYMLVWSLSGVFAYGGALAVEAASARAGLSTATLARLGGGLFILAGIYQLSPLKNSCLAKCRSPLSFLITSWRDGIGGALVMGIEHGLFCLGCCWLLFAIMFPLGIMNVAAMAVITLFVLAEKVLPGGARIAAAAAAGLVVWGAILIATPDAIPLSLGGGAM